MDKKLYYAMAQSDDIDPEYATNDITKRCLSQLNGRKPDVGIIYMGMAVDHEKVLNIISEKLKNIELIGCTTDGEFSTETGYIQDSILLILFSSDIIQFIPGKIDMKEYNIENIRKEIKSSISRTGKSPKLGILFSDGIAMNSETSLEIMNSVFYGEIPVFGGAAGDSWSFTGTKQFYGNSVLESTSVYLIICGDFDFSFGTGTGWIPVGNFSIVNSSDKNVIKEIDNIRAIDFYRGLLGDGATPSIEMPMAVYDQNNSFIYLRTALENNIGEDGSITFLGNIPENYRVKLTVVDRNSILDGVITAVENAKMKFPSGNKPSIAICFSCTARRAVLGSRTDEECSIVKSRLDENTIICGFYTYGEFSPPEASMKSIFHNETFVCLLIE